jgi:hypothetical protein
MLKFTWRARVVSPTTTLAEHVARAAEAQHTQEHCGYRRNHTDFLQRACEHTRASGGAHSSACVLLTTPPDRSAQRRRCVCVSVLTMCVLSSAATWTVVGKLASS